MAKKVSLTQYLVEQQREHGRIPSQLRLLIEVVARACKHIAIAVNKGALGDVMGTAGTENVQGEVQKKLDIISNEVLIEANEWGGHLAAMASEEMDTIHVVPNRYPQGEYLLLFDPLDGSSNIDVNVSIGTIFSVLRKVGHHHGVAEEDFLQAGKNQAAEGKQERTEGADNAAATQPVAAGHQGLTNMMARAGSIGATLRVESAVGTGTHIVVELPDRAGS